MYSFCQDSGCVDGQNPLWLARGRDGNFYGTTYNGGAQGVGTIFKITPAGSLTTLYSFCSKAACIDGSHPRAGPGRVPNSDDFYRTTSYGGSRNLGTLLRITSAGRLEILHNFHRSDGEYPVGGVLALRGAVYGTTA